MAHTEPVTVLLPVRNGERTLRAAIQDLLIGMRDSDELLVVDDGSEDGTPAILAQAEDSDDRLRVIRTSGTGLVGALNLGMRESSHRLIARADADDRYPVERLERQRTQLSPGVVLVTGDYRIRAGGKTLGEIPCAITPPFVAASMIHPQRIPHPGVLFDRDAVIDAGGYRPEDFPAEDLALWLRLSACGEFVGTPSVTVDWTMSLSSVSHRNQAIQRQKTASLLRVIPSSVVAQVNVDGVRKEIAAYSDTRLEGVRKVLLARDLHSMASVGLPSIAYKESLRALGRHPVNTAMAITQVFRGKRRRDRVRASIGAVEQ